MNQFHLEFGDMTFHPLGFEDMYTNQQDLHFHQVDLQWSRIVEPYLVRFYSN